jgi:hypothetical protein
MKPWGAIFNADKGANFDADQRIKAAYPHQRCTGIRYKSGRNRLSREIHTTNINA